MHFLIHLIKAVLGVGDTPIDVVLLLEIIEESGMPGSRKCGRSLHQKCKTLQMQDRPVVRLLRLCFVLG